MTPPRMGAAVAHFTFDGQDVPLRPGDTYGAALHRAGVRVISRSMKYHRPRGLYCCTGSCASCFVAADGVPNVPACTTAARNGARLESQNTLGSARRDLLGVVDKVYRKGFDPHNAFTRPRVINDLFLRSVRLMSGVGRVPSVVLPQEPGPLHRTKQVDHLVVGAGRHGLEAARRHARAGTRTLVVDELPEPGGSALWDPTDDRTRDLLEEAPSWPGVQLWGSALAFGMYDNVVGVVQGGDLWELRAPRITVAPGSHDAWPLFENNDLPGVLSLRGARRLLHGHDVLPGTRIVGHGGALPRDFVQALEAAGGEVVAQGEVATVQGRSAVERALVDRAWVDCDAVVCHLPGQPRVELFQQAGCRLAFRDGALHPVADGEGRTSRKDVFAALEGP